MTRYRIGRIEGQWKNFSPPIQGGVYRTKEQISEQAEETDSTHEGDTASSGDSRSPSPVFDTNNGKDARQRTRAQRGLSDASSSTSVEEINDGMSFLDHLTREHIKLDLDKYPAQDLDTQAKIMAKYRELHQRIRDEGLYQCNYWAYAVECCRYISLFALMLVCIHY